MWVLASVKRPSQISSRCNSMPTYFNGLLCFLLDICQTTKMCRRSEYFYLYLHLQKFHHSFQQCRICRFLFKESVIFFGTWHTAPVELIPFRNSFWFFTKRLFTEWEMGQLYFILSNEMFDSTDICLQFDKTLRRSYYDRFIKAPSKIW